MSGAGISRVVIVIAPEPALPLAHTSSQSSHPLALGPHPGLPPWGLFIYLARCGML